MQCELHWVEVIKLDNRTVEVIKFNDNNTTNITQRIRTSTS